MNVQPRCLVPRSPQEPVPSTRRLSEELATPEPSVGRYPADQTGKNLTISFTNTSHTAEPDKPDDLTGDGNCPPQLEVTIPHTQDTLQTHQQADAEKEDDLLDSPRGPELSQEAAPLKNADTALGGGGTKDYSVCYHQGWCV